MLLKHLFCAFQRTDKHNHQQPCGYRGRDLQQNAFVRLGLVVKIQIHDHIKEQYHDCSRIDNYVYGGQKLSIQQNVMAGDTKECNDEV